MPVRIKKLNCRVTVKKGGKGTIEHQDYRPAKPAMAFALPFAQTRSEQTMPEPSMTATQEQREPDAEIHRPRAEPKQVDARAVSDRVYELMVQEIRLSRQRGGIGRKG